MRTPEQERVVGAWLKAKRGLVLDLIAPYFRGLSDEDAEDLEAEANAAAARAFEDWTAGHESGATVDTLAGRYISAVLANYRRLRKTKTAKTRREERSFEEIVVRYDDGQKVTLGETIEAPDEWAPLDARLMLDDVAASPSLSPRQREALALRREGVGLRKTAAALGVSESGARDLIARTERSARRALGVAPVK